MQQHRKNKITSIKDDARTWQDQLDDIATILVNYYHDLFLSSRPNHSTCVLDQIQPVIAKEMNNHLTSSFLENEVEATLKQMAPPKTPRPDGMPPFFHQHFWPMLNSDVTYVVPS